MVRNADNLKYACYEFAQNIARINAFGDRLSDNTEILWDEKYAAAQLWEIISSARLLSLAISEDGSAFYTPTRRPAPHPNCVKTYPHKSMNELNKPA
jgi:hypothetical protein